MWGCCCLFSSAYSRGADNSDSPQLSINLSLNEDRAYEENMKITKGRPKTRREMRTFIKQELIRNFSGCCFVASRVDHILDNVFREAVESALTKAQESDGAGAVSDRQMYGGDDPAGCYVTIYTDYTDCGGDSRKITQSNFQITCSGAGELKDFINFDKSNNSSCCIGLGAGGMSHTIVSDAPRLCCCLPRFI